MWVVYNQDGVLQKVVNNTANGRVSVSGDAFEIVVYFGSDFDYDKPATITLRRPDDSVLVELAMTKVIGKTFVAPENNSNFTPFVNGQTYTVYVYSASNYTVLNTEGVYNATVRVYNPISTFSNIIYVMGRFDFYVEDAVESLENNITPSQYQDLIAQLGDKISQNSNLPVKHINNITNINLSSNIGKYIAGDVVFCDTNKKLFSIAGTGSTKTYSPIDMPYLKLDGTSLMTGNLKLNGNNLLLSANEESRIYSDNDNIYFLSNGGDIFAEEGSFIPVLDNEQNLGNNSHCWKDLYLKGNLKDGTNNISIANIQHTLTAGSNINISGNIISAVDTTYTAGTGIDITNNVISVTDTGEYISVNEKGAANGVATLDSNGKVPFNQIPDVILGQLKYKGVWNASTGTSGLVKEKGDYYVCQVGGDKNPDASTHSGLSYAVGDWAVCNGMGWDKIDNTDAVSSVNGKTGAVVLNANDINYDANTTAKQKIDSKSTVSVSSSGTATDTVQYITINGVEKKLAGGGVVPENVVTTDTAQTITGSKNFSNGLKINNSSIYSSLEEGHDFILDGDVKINDVLNVNGAVAPETNEHFNLGTENKKWNNLYLNGSIIDGTNTIAVSEIIKATGNQTISGLKKFTTIPETDGVSYTVGNANQLANTGYVDSKVSAEAVLRGSADTVLQGNINRESLSRISTDTELQNSVNTINGKIPTQASATNQLADKEFVNSSIATQTGHYISNNGNPFTSLQQLNEYTQEHYGEIGNNDYAIITGTDTAGNTFYDRYKYTTGATTGWAFEYRLNNSSFTAVQWNAINSGITATNVAQITTNKNDILTKQNLITAENKLSYNLLSDTPNIPSKTSDLTNDSGFITGVSWNDVTSKPTFSTVATSGNYNDLSNKPTIPTKTSDLTNNSGFITNSYHDSSKQNTLVSGTNIKTINNQSILGSGNITISGGVTDVQKNGTSIVTAGVANILYDNQATNGSTNLITSGAVFNATYNKEDKLSAGSNIVFTDIVKSKNIYDIWNITSFSAPGFNVASKTIADDGTLSITNNSGSNASRINPIMSFDDLGLEVGKTYTITLWCDLNANSNTLIYTNGSYVSYRSGSWENPITKIWTQQDITNGVQLMIYPAPYTSGTVTSFRIQVEEGSQSTEYVSHNVGQNFHYISAIVPTKTSDLTNDSGYITLSDVPSEFYWCVDGVTTYAEIEEAVAAGKLPIINITDSSGNTYKYVYSYKYSVANRLYFMAPAPECIRYCYITSPNNYQKGTWYAQEKQLVTTISSSSTNTQYPSAKAVYTNLQAKQDASTLETDVKTFIDKNYILSLLTNLDEETF